MSIITKLSSREAIPVSIGELTLWCEEFKASAVKSFSEEATVSGDTVITNSCSHSLKLIFSGRICSEESPVSFVQSVNNMLRTQESFNVEYRGLAFSQCRIQSFSAEDRGEDFINASLTLVTAENVSLSGG